jgi:hypothetical protein
MSLIPPEQRCFEYLDREKLIDYIKAHDPFFADADFNRYSWYELKVIKVSIDVEKEKLKQGTQ